MVTLLLGRFETWAYNWGMNMPNENVVRAAFDKYVARKGQGAIKRLADLAGINRVTVSRYRKRKPIRGDTYFLLVQALEEVGAFDEYYADYPSEREAEWAANRSELRDVAEGLSDPRSPYHLIATRLYSVADVLVSERFSEDRKRRELSDLVGMFADFLGEQLGSENSPKSN